VVAALAMKMGRAKDVTMVQEMVLRLAYYSVVWTVEKEMKLVEKKEHSMDEMQVVWSGLYSAVKMGELDVRMAVHWDVLMALYLAGLSGKE
jgi:hypothetical protein